MSLSDKPPGFIGIASGGIQNVSPFLPLLGTGQCEKQVTSALQRGLLYAAATPMSIFGSLGIAKAGFIVFCTSIDNRLICGPTLLRDAGFLPSGLGFLLTYVPDKYVADREGHLYVAEEKVRHILSKKRIHSVKINLASRDLLWWNTKLFIATVILGSCGLLPYIFIISRHLSDQPFQATWVFPVTRIVGCGVVAFTIQIIFELRILEETYSRIRFMATDAFYKDHGRSYPGFWDPSEHSKDILKQLKAHYSKSTNNPVTAGLGTISTFQIPGFREKLEADDKSMDPQPGQNPPNYGAVEQALHDLAANHAGVQMPRLRQLIYQTTNPEIYLTSLCIVVAQIFLLAGCVMTIVGYIGCFSVIQAAPSSDWKAPLVWLSCEIALALFRTLMWAWNPKWDDAKSPIGLEKVAITIKSDRSGKPSSSYGIGWGLDLVTADDMHALIVGINKFGSSPGQDATVRDLRECVNDAKRVARYLVDTLLVPPNQIVTLYDAQATKEHIIQELQRFSEKMSVMPDAPIVIYFATHSFVRADTRRTYLIPYQGASRSGEALWNASLSYDTIVDLLQLIGQKKTENITLILDTCHAGSMGKNEKFNSPSSSNRQPASGRKQRLSAASQQAEQARFGRGMMPVSRAAPKNYSLKNTEILVGHSSHVLLAGSGPDEEAHENVGEGGVFTRSLLDTLRESDGVLRKMKHKDLVDGINERLTKAGNKQKAVCTSIYKNRLLFNGLFSRRVPTDGGKPVITVHYSDY